MDASSIKAHLGLEPLPFEGGFYAETYRSNVSTAIYYLLTRETFSRIHRLTDVEVYHFYLGDPVELLLLDADGSELRILGQDLERGQLVQTVVPSGVWQGSRLVPGGRFALLGTTMAPPFALENFEAADASIIEQYPDREALIKKLI